MAWNHNKAIQPDEKKAISIGAPVSYNAGLVGKPYTDGWDIERAYREGVAKVTWVYRAIDAIASNQARERCENPEPAIQRRRELFPFSVSAFCPVADEYPWSVY